MKIVPKTLAELSSPPGARQPYLRPLLCPGDWKRIAVFVAGINPATAIYPSNIALHNYVKLLRDYAAFQKFYREIRRRQGKPLQSRTRPWIERLSRYVQERHKLSVAETNVVPLPTCDVQELYRKPNSVLRRARKTFSRLLMLFEPRVIVLHGADALAEFQTLIRESELRYEFPSGTGGKTLASKEHMVPFMRIEYRNAGARSNCAAVLVSRHFRMYQFDTAAFGALKDRVGALL